MEFEDIQVIWNKQESEPIFVVDADALYSRLRKSDVRVKRGFKIEEWTIITMVLAFGGALAHEPILFGHDYYQLYGAATAFILGIFLLLNKFRREKQEVAFDQSISGIVDASIDRIQAYHDWLKRAMFWLWVMIVSTAIFGGVFGGNGKMILHFLGGIEISKRPFTLVLFATLIPFLIWFQRREQTKKQRRIESLKRLKSQFTNKADS